LQQQTPSWPAETMDEMPQKQPEPKANDNPHSWDLVLQDMAARDAFGAAKYGVHLQPGNGRDTLRDAYEEALDLCVYLRTAIFESESSRQKSTASPVDTPKHLTVREACKRRIPLCGVDAEVLESALTMTEEERDQWVARAKNAEEQLAEIFRVLNKHQVALKSSPLPGWKLLTQPERVALVCEGHDNLLTAVQSEGERADKLNCVVDAARAVLAILPPPCDCADTICRNQQALVASLRAALAALDAP
jgi:hypothetical protein